jgi:hypothetical protein
VGSFDNVIEAAQTVFVSITAGYTLQLYAVQDSTTPGESPELNASFFSGALFFFAIHGIFTLFLINIFIGVISKTFSEESGKSLITDQQQRWDRCASKVDGFSPGLDQRLTYQPVPEQHFYRSRLAVFHLIVDPRFILVSQCLLLFDAAQLATVRARSGRLRSLRVLHRKSGLYGVFVWARKELNGLKRRFSARAVALPARVRGVWPPCIFHARPYPLLLRRRDTAAVREPYRPCNITVPHLNGVCGRTGGDHAHAAQPDDSNRKQFHICRGANQSNTL